MISKMSFLSKLSKFTSIDYHIGITLLFRLWSIFAGGILIILIPFSMSESEQGYFFTFSSLIAMQVFFELGFNFVVVQLVGHEMAHVTCKKNGKLDGAEFNISRIYSLISLLRKWYAVISVFFFIIVFLSGIYFFHTTGELSFSKWLPAWILLVFFSSINLFVSPFLAVLEGMGFVGQVASIRLAQSFLGYATLIILLLSGYGLIATPVISGTAALISLIWVLKKYRALLFKNDSYSAISKISWRKEIFPFQWKIALSWLSGYFIFQLFNPMLFAHQGAIEAGKIGLTLAAFNSMLSLSMSWITAKSPVMAGLIAGNERFKLNSLFKSLLFKSLFLNVIISGSFLLFVVGLKHYNIALATRIVDVNILLVLLFISLINHLIFSMAVYMRAHKQEPMLWNSLVVGLITLPLIFYFSRISTFATMLSYSAVITFISLPWCYILFMKYYKGLIKINEINKK
ncbi:MULTISPECIES: hypothetical protein [Yersinia]|uniref:hypothetical protein n=1 Tax=Yersinia TaxID=629 RepID=UPI000CF66BE0|nr:MULTISPECIES: hypothetical protein [Yersinia]ARB86061.2 hypothetical protein A6J67_20270 [Yersinia sp. FDAARGOS_228]AVL35910.1 hypothetical protein CEQ36_09950 [Yersinia intermedia]